MAAGDFIRAGRGATVTRARRSALRRVASALVLLAGVSLAADPAFSGSCSYEIEDEWNNGFKGKVTLSNGDMAVSDWGLQWTWPSGTSLNNGWNASFDCSANRCSITPPAWQNGLAAGESYSFGFTAQKPAGTSTAVVDLEGEFCGSAGSSLWTLDPDSSSLHYVSTKKDHIAEINTFTHEATGRSAMAGSIDASGQALLAIDLNAVSTGIATRDSRLLNLLFETALMPRAFLRVAVDIAGVEAMAAGQTRTDALLGELSLHGARQGVVASVLIAKLSADAFTVSTLAPVIVDSENFDMALGIEALRSVAGLSVIGESVPVYFNLSYRRSNDSAAEGLAFPEAPEPPTELAGSFNANTAEAALAWLDNSDVETDYLLRRRSVDGAWGTVAELPPDSMYLEEGLPDSGEFDYKVIALNQGMPSLPSNIERVSVTEGNQLVRGENHYAAQCAGCHGSQGEGTANFPPLNTARDMATLISYIAANMPLNDAASCGEDCSEDVAAFIQTLWVEETACNLALSPVSYGARQLKMLTQFEYQNSVEDLIGVDYEVADGLSADTKIGFFYNNTHSPVTAAAYSNYLLVAEEIAAWSAERSFSPALDCGSIGPACVDEFVNELAPRVFRRPLSDEERNSYRALADGSETSGDIEAGLKLALEALLSSPQFIYRHELGERNPANTSIDNDAFELTSYEMATFLAYTLTGSTPDQPLLAAAERDELRDEVSILAHATRLADKAKASLGNFVGSWLGTAELELAAKDPALWPDFPSLVPHLKSEINEMFAHVLLTPGERFSSLYDANYTFVNGPLASHYGMPGVAGSRFEKISTSDRGGILANGAFMARWGEAEESSPILRSVRVRRRMLCQEQPDPPAGTFAAREEKLAALSDFLMQPTTTNRMKYHRLTEDSPCTTCHLEYINPLGFGMEDFDTVGRLRSVDRNANPIDASGVLFAPNRYSDIHESLAFTGTRGLGALLAQQPAAQACLPQQMFRYVMGVGYQNINRADPGGPQLVSDAEKSGYACEVDRLQQTMMSVSPRSMLESFGVLESVRYRKAWPRNAGGSQ
ncbi:MAG: DUF1592 domain-containing protein [Pseudomonadota bacterium]